MSINSIIKDYTLQEWSETYDDYGNPVYGWDDVTTISASISYTHSIVTNNDVSYKVMTPEGMTNFRAFDSDKKYQLVGDKTFEITSWYDAERFVLLALKEVS